MSPGQNFQMNGVPQIARDEAIDVAKNLLREHHANILDFKMLSDLSLSMIVEINASQILPLATSLIANGWRLQCEPPLETFSSQDSRQTNAIEGTFQMTFKDGTGELKIPVPAVPG